MTSPHDKEWIYLDHAAATPLDDRVLQAMQPFFAHDFYNPSATYAPAVAVARQLQAARVRLALWLGARPGEVIFTAGGTEANNLAIHGVMARYGAEANVVVSAIEHDAVLKPAAEYDCRQVAVDEQGMIDLTALEQAVDDKTVLISVMYANNEIGTIQPLREVTQLAEAVRDRRRATGNKLPLLVHTDACQAAGYLDVHAARLGVDMMTINGGKLYGPKQSGALYVRAGVELAPLVRGGGQERGLRSGTENVAACVGLATALELAQQQRQDETRRLAVLQQLFIELLSEALPQTRINGSLKKRLPNNVHITIPGADNERLVYQLEAAGILAAAGSACSAASGEPSHVLRAIGLSDEEARASLRFSLGRTTTEDQIRRTVTELAALIAHQ